MTENQPSQPRVLQVLLRLAPKTAVALAFTVCGCGIWCILVETWSSESGDDTPKKVFVNAGPDSVVSDIINNRISAVAYDGEWFSWHGTVEKISARQIEIHLADKPIRVRGILTDFEMGCDPISWGHQLGDELGFEARLTRIGYAVLDDNGVEYIVPSSDVETVNEDAITIKPTDSESLISEIGQVEATMVGAVVYMENVAFTKLSRYFPPTRAR